MSWLSFVLIANYLSLESILNESSDEEEEEEDYPDTFNDADSSILNFVRTPLLRTLYYATI